MKRITSFSTIVATAVVLVANPAAAQRPTAKSPDTPAKLMKEARISEPVARATALAAVPGGTVKSHELEREDGTLLWSYDISVRGKKGIEEVHVDAITGTLLQRKHETPSDERTEAAEEAAKARAGAAKKP